METIKEEQLVDLIKSKNINPYNLYHVDIDYPQYYCTRHYLQNPKDNIELDQKLKMHFFDIEVFTQHCKSFGKPEDANYPISAISTYHNNENKYTCYGLLINSNFEKINKNTIELANKLKKQLVEKEYMTEDQQLEMKLFTNEIELIKTYWKDLNNYDPSNLVGWNSDTFDIPYIYYRTVKLFDGNDKSAHKIMSKLENVKVKNYGGKLIIDFPEYISTDLYYLFKPRADGGLAQGKKLASYSLDFVCDAMLKLKKFDYKNDGTTLDRFYEQDPENYFLYNIIDTCLIKLLNDKLKHVDRYNLLRRLMKTTLGMSLRGPSALFDTFVLHELKGQEMAPRFGILDEYSLEIPEHYIKKFPRPITSKPVKWTVKSIDNSTYREITGRYPGASMAPS